MFEGHITIRREDYEKAKPLAEKRGWHMSNISDDEVMGPGARAYCTKSYIHFNSLDQEQQWLMTELVKAGVDVKRRKIEAIIIDVRY